MSVSSPSFFRLVQALKGHKKTLTVVESCCGGLINASIMAVPNSSKVYYGGSIAYNTRKAKPLLLNHADLHTKLLTGGNTMDNTKSSNEADRYVESKLHWTSETAKAFCKELETDYAIAEGGAAGPTFRPEGLDRGFAVIAVAARDEKDGSVSVVKQEVVRSTHADRIKNMRLFADRAAELALDVVTTAADDMVDASFLDSKDTREPMSQRHLDRATHLRSDPNKLEAMAKEGMYVVLHDNEALCWEGWELAKLNQAQVDNICESLDIEPDRTFLGLLDGREAVFGVDVYTSHEDQERVRAAGTECSGGAKFENTRTGAPLMSSIHNEMVLHATALAQWQRRAPYCSACGSTTRLVDGGTCQECSAAVAKKHGRDKIHP
jgi:nicotinamide mononucleotide (NMN) deamidase PncC